MGNRRSPDHLGSVFELADAIGRREKIALSDEGFGKKIGSEIVRLVEKARSSPVNVHGHRTELMFGYVAASLRTCRAVKREDAGELFVSQPKRMSIPDYRLVLEDGSQQLVEVKNGHHTNGEKELRLREADVARLQDYAETFGLPLRFAIYWSRWRLWSLITPEDMRRVNGKYCISLVDAIGSNRMADLGDFHLATTPPARLRIVADPEQPRKIAADGQASFTIGEVKMFAGDVEVTERKERDLLLYMMFYGRWTEGEPEAHVVHQELEHIDFVAAPVEPADDQPFDIAGAMSTMISSQYLDMTTHGHVVRRLAPSVSPDTLGRHPPGRIEDMTLPLWVFVVGPKDLAATEA